jgi:hypothetical protein
MRQGFLFLFLALVLGLAVVALPHPSRWLAAHLTAFLTGLILVVIALAWNELRLTDGQRTLAYVTGLVAAYGGLVGNVFGAITDLPGPASNPGVVPPMPQAAVFYVILAIIVPQSLHFLRPGVLRDARRTGRTVNVLPGGRKTPLLPVARKQRVRCR